MGRRFAHPHPALMPCLVAAPKLTTAGPDCTAQVLVHDLSMNLVRSSQTKMHSVSTECPDAEHEHKDSLSLHNQFLEQQLRKAIGQLQHQQKMVQLLLKQLGKERERRHSMEDALVESRSCLCPCCTTAQGQLTFDSGPGHSEISGVASPAM